ncbi:hypothetical protein TNCV_1587681 [Trichonephila clavipes]|uniref:Uncharacterized protein n=1 Tax=Trichonephila clavipes TaxID=2585209 RepID=A0A8X6RL69_TRICX|nr:hypothetical protein TNCV_1587681 [Trichonephila clavipes]
MLVRVLTKTLRVLDCKLVYFEMVLFARCSKMEATTTEAEVYIKTLAEVLRSGKTVFYREVTAVSVISQHLNTRPSLDERAVFLSDSQAAILAMANCCQAPVPASVKQCKSLLGDLQDESKTVVMQCIPSCFGILGNGIDLRHLMNRSVTALILLTLIWS